MGFNTALARLSEESFQFLLKNGKRSSMLDGHDFESLTLCSWKFLKETLPELIKIGNFEKLVLEIFRDRGINIFSCDVDRIEPNDILHFIFWIKDELEAINKLEADNLNSEPDADLNAAGIHEMNVFGDLNTIDQLAGGDILKWEAIKQLRYHQVFDKQLKSIIENRIEKKYAKAKSKPKQK